MRSTRLFEDLRAADALPSPRGVALDLLRAMEDDSVKVAKLANIVIADPAISAHVLRVANDGGASATDPKDAAAALSPNSLRAITLACTILSDNREGGCDLFDYERFWSRSLACACALKRLAPVCEDAQLELEEAFAYGLLSRIGRLGVVSAKPELYAKVLLSLDGFSDAALESAEEKIFEAGTDWLSALMIDAWGLSKYRRSLDPADGDADDPTVEKFGTVMRLAEAIAAALIAPELTTDLVDEVGHQCAALNIDAKTWVDVLEGTIEDWNTVGRELAIRTRSEAIAAQELLAAVG